MAAGSTVPVQFLLVQLANMYFEPGNHNINLAKTNNDTSVGISVVQITKDQLMDAKKLQEIEIENHLLGIQLNMTELQLHRVQEENQMLRREQVRHKVRKALLRNITSEYFKTKKELAVKIANLAHTETKLSIYETELGHIKQESDTWRRKCERYESKFMQAFEGELEQKGNEKLINKVTNENCKGERCKEGETQKNCGKDRTWCCWMETEAGNILDDNSTKTAVEENDEKTCKELALIEASKTGNLKIILQLIEENTNIQTSFPKSPLHWATENGNYEACYLLINRDADVNAHDQYNFNTTPVHVAAELGEVRILNLFLKEAEVDIDAKDLDGWTPLHWAVTFEQTDAVKLLLKSYANVNIANNEGESPLHLAALSGNPDIVSMLIQHEAEVNARDNDGRTPLHLATLSYNSSNSFMSLEDNLCNLKMLLKHNTSINIHSGSEGHLLNHTIHPSSKSLPACLGSHDCNEMASILLHKGADPFAKDKKNITAVDGAAKECKSFLTSWIIQNKNISITSVP